MTMRIHTFTLNDCSVAPERTMTSSTFDCNKSHGENHQLEERRAIRRTQLNIHKTIQVNHLVSVSEFWDHLRQDLLKITTTTFGNVALKVVITLLENLLKVNVRYKALHGEIKSY